MITDNDRSGWFGASDARYIMGSWKTKSFEKWWLEKLGIIRSNYTNESMQAGTAYEHPILEAMNIPEMDTQILLPEYLLRVNLDGNDTETDYEVKTYRYSNGFKLHTYYDWQVQIQMFASRLPKANILAYGLEDADYKNFFRPIDRKRLSIYPIIYRPEWVEKSFLPRLTYLKDCLQEGRRFPNDKVLRK